MDFLWKSCTFWYADREFAEKFLTRLRGATVRETVPQSLISWMNNSHRAYSIHKVIWKVSRGIVTSHDRVEAWSACGYTYEYSYDTYLSYTQYSYSPPYNHCILSRV